MAEELTELAKLEERIGYRFKNRGLLIRSLTHPSYNTVDPQQEHNQRLEFLGDAVLGLILAEMLYEDLPDEREGVLTRYRSILVKGDHLCQLAREIHLGRYLQMGEAEISQGGRKRDSILEDALEALIGAVYLDGGFAAARVVVLKIYGTLKDRLEEQVATHNPKGRLQELVQPEIGNESIEYRVTEETGPDHQKHFTVEVWIGGQMKGSGSGSSKKLAEEAAAREALLGLDLASLQ